MTATPYSLTGKRIWVAGHRGMVGSAIVRRLCAIDCEIVTAGRETLDLTRQADVEAWMANARPDAVFLAAAKVGGIHANNSRPAEFIHDNLVIETSIIDAAHQTGVEKLLFLGSACIYPREAPQPMAEGTLLTGPLEPTNEAYALAKIAGIKLCQAYRRQYGCDFIAAQPNNLYGPGDNFDLMNSHVLPALMNKAHTAKLRGDKQIEVWGSGRPKREFLYVEDLADALVFLMENYSDEGHVNIGTGEEVTIRELAERVCETVGFEGELVFNADQPDGVMRKLVDVSLINSLGWMAKTDLATGLDATYRWFVENREHLAAGRGGSAT
ncbi:MAG: GDP-L-fucose synthase [Rhodospirillales bacterium]